MKVITYNESNLSDEEIDRKACKVRGLIFNNQNEVLLCKYAGLYILPGGSIDEGETKTEAFIREIQEETGIDVNQNDINQFLIIKDYNRNYYDRKLKTDINRLTETTFFQTKTNSEISSTNRNLTESELKNGFTVQFVKVDLIPEILKGNDQSNEKVKVFERELLTVLQEYEVYTNKITRC